MEEKKITLGNGNISDEELMIYYHQKAKQALKENKINQYYYYLECAKNFIPSNNKDRKVK